MQKPSFYHSAGIVVIAIIILFSTYYILTPNCKSNSQPQPEVNQNPSFNTLLAAGYRSQVDFLLSRMVEPLQNRVNYENSGQLKSKLIERIALFGKDAETTLSFVTSLKAELPPHPQGGKGWSLFTRRKEQTFTFSNPPEAYIRSLFAQARANIPAIIFLEDICVWGDDREKEIKDFSNWHVFDIIEEEMKKSPLGDILLVAGVDAEWQITFIFKLRDIFPTRLHIPRHLNSAERKELIFASTRKWANPPGPEIVEEITRWTGELNNGRVDVDDDIRLLTLSAYRHCLDRVSPKEGKDKGIHWTEIDPTFQLEGRFAKLASGIEGRTQNPATRFYRD